MRIVGLPLFLIATSLANAQAKSPDPVVRTAPVVVEEKLLTESPATVRRLELARVSRAPPTTPTLPPPSNPPAPPAPPPPRRHPPPTPPISSSRRTTRTRSTTPTPSAV